jgi:hypothetical protein
VASDFCCFSAVQMIHRLLANATAVFVIASLAIAAAPTAKSQQIPTKSWEPPHTSDDQPDIQGFWNAERGGPNGTNIQTGLQNADTARLEGMTKEQIAARKPVSSIVDPANGKIPYQPWAQKRYQEILSRYNGEHITGEPQTARDVSPMLLCINGGAPFSLAWFSNLQITQTAGYVILSLESTHEYRVIPIDRTGPSLPENVKLYKGDSRGHWDGNTLVVHVANLNDWTWFDSKGTFHTDAMTVVERFTFSDDKTIKYQATITDPKAFTQPWTMSWTLKRAHAAAEHYEQIEDTCTEGEKAFNTLLGHVYPNRGIQ